MTAVTHPPMADSLVSTERHLNAIAAIKPYGATGTSVGWVNWRASEYQIKVTWNNSEALECYLNFFSAADRDFIHAKLFARYAEAGSKPFKDEGHGWTVLRHNFRTSSILTINEMARLADELGVRYTVIYKQSSNRHLFEIMGIPLAAGESGKEVVDGQVMPYRCLTGKCL